MWEPRRLTHLWVSTTCYTDSFTFTYISSTEYYGTSYRIPFYKNIISFYGNTNPKLKKIKVLIFLITIFAELIQTRNFSAPEHSGWQCYIYLFSYGKSRRWPAIREKKQNCGIKAGLLGLFTQSSTWWLITALSYFVSLLQWYSTLWAYSIHSALILYCNCLGNPRD
jgi:hypothetical protein